MIIILVIYLMVAGFFIGLSWDRIEDMNIRNFMGALGVSLVWIVPFTIGIIEGIREDKEEA